jgi:MFS family permease
MGSSLLGRDRDFRLFWAGQTVSVFGSQITAVVLPLIAALTIDAGAAGVGAVATAAFLPNVALPLVAGAWLESRPKRPAMIGADILRALALGVIPAAWFAGELSVALLVVVALVVGAASVVFDIASFAYVPTLVTTPELPSANRAMQGSATAAQVGGPGVAGLLVQAVGAPAAVIVDAVSYVASACGIAAMNRRESPQDDLTCRTGILGGLRWIWSNYVLRALTAHAALYNAASQVLMVNLVVYAVGPRNLSAGMFGLTLSAGGFGALIGTLVSVRAMRALRYGRAFALSLILSTGTPLLIPLLSGRGVEFALQLAAVLVVSGVGLGSANVLSVTLRQVVTPVSSLARTNGGYRLVIFGTIPIGSALGGVVGATLGSRVGVSVGVAGLAISALPMITSRIRRLENAEAARDEVGAVAQ